MRDILDSHARPALWAVLVFVLTLNSCDFQDHMLYHPSKTKPSQASLTPYHIRFWDHNAEDYRGYVGTVPIADPKGTVVVFHGNAGGAADRAYYVRALEPLGYRVILAEYPGYGGRKGKPGETVFVADARETIRRAFEEFGGPVLILGESLGCGVAAAAVKDSAVRIDGVILITPWDTLLAVAKAKFPWLPVRLLLKDQYDSIANLGAFQGRIAIAAAERDQVIPVQHARALYQALSKSAKLWIIPGAGHNNWLDRVDRSWWQAIMDYAAGHGD